ncbi:SusC/RagA family TonB-linked outer membrane protein [Ichthyobacterium seriolicida]|uniref:TonB-dependent receptor n=1 Tax=Ichthyobacterium seriolicida TaxID=242600 RepID=A0A1J1EBU0_9FLAO|nr:SusC/RagA family TonB-linked outer membrane protein [Ichthyobacterium seriolicida]BAV95403.1 TonB-dependent receptor [Ichthyobacterium seriolicida]
MRIDLGKTILVFLSLHVNLCFAQFSLSGTVLSKEDELPLPGVEISIEGTDKNTSTNFDGEYSIEAHIGDVLKFSFLGLQTVRKKVVGKEEIDIYLEINKVDRDKIIDVGYGTQDEIFISDAIDKMPLKEIYPIPLGNLLMGKIPGALVNQQNEIVDSDINITVRGLSSVTRNILRPMYVIDGIEMPTYYNVDPLSFINQNDIESITVLKDASSKAIYGVKGSNGVVILNTKRGSDKNKFSLSLYKGLSIPTRKLNLLNGPKYKELLLESLKNAGYSELGAEKIMNDSLSLYQGDRQWKNIDNNWQDLAFQMGYTRDANFSFYGGNEVFKSYVSLGYNDKKGILVGDKLSKYTFSFNMKYNLNEKINFGIISNAFNNNYDYLSADKNLNKSLDILKEIPVSPSYLTNGEINKNTYMKNKFLLEDKIPNNRNTSYNLYGKTFVNYFIFPELTLRSELGYNLYNSIDGAFMSKYLHKYNRFSYSANNYITIKQEIPVVGKIKLMFGTSFRRNNIDSSLENSKEVLAKKDDINISDNKNVFDALKYSVNSSYLSYFIRLNYILSDKYFIKMSLTGDSDSYLDNGYNHNTFFSVSSGWIISREKFMEPMSSVVSNLKLRTSWGIIGNSPYENAFTKLFSSYHDEDKSPISVFKELLVFNLQLEKTQEYNIGLDYSLYEDRLTGSLDLYKKITNGVFLNSQYDKFKDIGISNQGIEFSLNTKSIVLEDLSFLWNTNFSISVNINKIRSLGGGADIVIDNNILRQGSAINSFYLKEYAGVNPNNGKAMYYKNTLKNNGELDKTKTENYQEAEKRIFGSLFPSAFIWLNNTIKYIGFDLSFAFQATVGGKRYSKHREIHESGFSKGLHNQSSEMLKRWQKKGDNSNTPKLIYGIDNGSNPSTRFLESSDHLHLKELVLGYSLSDIVLEKIGMSHFRIYLSALNIPTLTNYKSYDRESISIDPLAQSMIISMGLNMRF